VADREIRLVYWLCRQRVPRLLARYGHDATPDDIEERVQDAAARAFAGFLARCSRQCPPTGEARNWLCQCTVAACRAVCRTARRIGSEIPQSGYIDAMNRRGNPDGLRGIRHGSDCERQRYLESIPTRPDHPQPVSREDVEKAAECLPERIRLSCVYARYGHHATRFCGDSGVF
jgi:DNA-directed RNA polymerase specialized sigma24 family protein